MPNLNHLTQRSNLTFAIEAMDYTPTQSSLTCVCYHENIQVSSLKLYLAPTGLKNDTLLTFLDNIELIAVELYDAAKDCKKLQKQLSQSRFAYLTQFQVHPDFQNQGIGGLMLDYVETLLQILQIPNLYLISVADTKVIQQKLHHLYSHHYFTYAVIPHPDKPAVMHRKIE